MSWLRKKSVVVPVDFSERSLAAVDAALELVEVPKQLHVIHVLPVLEPNDPGVIWSAVDDKSRTRHVQQHLAERFADPKYKDLNYAVAFGDPGSEITRHAEKVFAELIVLPSHGRTGLNHILIGSVAERVVRLAHCPVLVLRD